MKKILFLLATIALIFTQTSCDDDDKRISFDRLPAESQLFIETHFQNVTIRFIEEDNDSYDVYLQNGYEVDFFKNGEWKNVDGNYQALPASLLSLTPFDIVSAYVNEQYPERFITEVDKDRQKNGYEVTLNNNLELIFEWDGTFRNIDY
jgi:Protein of unknown function (DUF2874).